MTESTTAERDTGIVQSVDRAVTILEALAHAGEAGVTDVAAELGVHKSTAFRLLGTLEQRGLVEQADDRGKYRIGIGLVRLASTTTARLDLVKQGRPACQKLAAETGETINIAILAENSALYLDQIAGSAALQPHNWVGRRIPLHATSNGKVLLAPLDRSEVDELLPDLEAYTDRTITRRATLHRELAEVHERGYAVAVDELEEGLSAIAAPVYDAHGDLIAALSVSGTTYRLDADTLASTAGPLLDAAAEISEAMGWNG